MLLVEDRTNALRSEIAKAASARTENVDYLRGGLESDIPRLQEAIKAETVEREELGAALQKKAGEELQKLNESVAGDKKSREETEEAMLEMLKDMVGRLNAEIDGERKDRLATEETLLGLLEETCTKLTSATQQI